MKIGEAKQQYYARFNELWNKGMELRKKIEKNEKANDTEENLDIIVELSKIDEKLNKVSDFMNKFGEYTSAMHNAEVSKQQASAEGKAMDDMAKCMEIARRISKGDKVPASDEKKLFDFNFEMYMSAKNMGAMCRNEHHKEHESLWDEDEEKRAEHSGQDQSVEEIVNNMESTMDMPIELVGETEME